MNPIRRRLNSQAADAHLGQAKSILRVLKQNMALNDLKIGRMRRSFDGVEFDVLSTYGQDEIRIWAPPVLNQAVPELSVELSSTSERFGENLIVWFDVFWFVTNLDAIPDPGRNYFEPMFTQMRDVIAANIGEQVTAIEIDGVIVLPRYTVICDNAESAGFTGDGVHAFESTERYNACYVAGLIEKEFLELGEPLGEGYAQIDMWDWYYHSGDRMTRAQKRDVMFGDIAQKLMWFNGPPDIVADGPHYRALTTPFSPVFLADTGFGYPAAESANFQNRFNDGNRLVDAFEQYGVKSAWYTSSVFASQASLHSRAPLDIEASLPDSRLFEAKIEVVSEGETVTPASLLDVVDRASTYLAEESLTAQLVLAIAGRLGLGVKTEDVRLDPVTQVDKLL